MPLSTVKFLPGVNVETTPVLGMAQIVSSQLIRFKSAGANMVNGFQSGLEVLVEKLGGWQKFYPVSIGSPIRDMHAWEGIRADAHLGVGAEESLVIISSGSAVDVTPRTYFSSTTPSFTTTISSTTVVVDDPNITASIYDNIYILTPVAVGGIILQGGYQVTAVLDADSYEIEAASAATSAETTAGTVPVFDSVSGSPTITVTLLAHGYAVGELFNIPAEVATAVGGLTLSGPYIIQTVPTADTFTINAANSATSNDTQGENGGDVGILYFIGIGPTQPSAGYGTGAYGDGAYGIGIVPPASPGSTITATNWSLDNWGEVLLACPKDGAIYTFTSDSGLQNATRIVGSPLLNGGIFVSQPAQILVAWASSQGGVQDPLTINWSDAGDYTNWIVSSQTQAGGYHIPTGSRIVGGLAGPNFGIIWTDVDVWAMDYIEPPLIFGFNSLGSSCGLIAQHAAVVLNSTAYWMSNDKFCLLNGENVQTIPCPVWDFVFQDLDLTQTHKIYAGSNSLFGEVTFYFPSLSGGTGEVDSYVKFNTDLGVWDFGRLARSAWVDQSPVGQPVGASPDGYIYQHEVSPDADGQPMMSSFTSGYFAIADGEQLNFVDWMLPDFKFGYYGSGTGAIVQVTFNFIDYPNDTVKSKGPYSVSDTTPFVNTRFRARFAALQIGSQDLGSWWRMGGLKIRTAPDGKR